MKQSSNVATRQAPLRETYTRLPDEAITVKRARTTPVPSTDALHGTVVATGFPNQAWAYGIDAKVGGMDDLPNPGHLLCAALAACLDSTLRMIADHLKVEIEHLEVEVTGDVDVRGCLAMEDSVRPGFRQLRCDVRLELGAGTPERVREILLQHAERLCVTLDTLREGVPIVVSAGATDSTSAESSAS